MTGQPQEDAERGVENETQPLMTPAGEPKGGVLVKSVEAENVLWISGWMVLSSAVVIYNKWLFTTGGFPFPLALTSMHMTCCFFVFGAIRKFSPPKMRSAIMPDADVTITWSQYAKNFVMISIFYATTLGTGNLAYMFSSVAFVQMIKPMNCICASVACFALGVEHATRSHLIIVCIIVSGVSIATHHSANFSLTGLVLQLISSLSEGCRLGMVQYVTTSGLKLDPVTTVYHFSFACAVLLSCACFAFEMPLDLKDLYSPWALVLNCMLALVLNVVVATVIRKTSAVVFALSGIIKDLGIIAASSILFMTPITKLMISGYTISVAGLCMFKAYKDNMGVFEEKGFVHGMSHVGRSAIGSKGR